ncbi:MAG: hypothetical protein IJN34_08360 [Clostridia bacterium]|nr:hypothetical protein [Clostridia bacterium]
MKKWIAMILMGLILLSGCAKPNQPEPPKEEPNQTSASPIKGEWKDASITDEQRKQFFNLVKEYRVDGMYEFGPNQPMELDYFKYYCAYFISEEDKTYSNGGVNYTGKAVENLAKRFGTTYSLKEEDRVFVRAASLRDTPFAELIRYKKETVGGKELVTARCINYQFNEYLYNDRAEAELTYPAHREMVLRGEVTDWDGYEILDFSFYTEDGKTPAQFVSFSCYKAYALEDGTATLPEFK